MILLDFSPISIAAIMVALKRDHEVLTPKLVLHMTLNSIRMYNVKFRKEFGEMIICCDAKENWRKKAFPYYKANRKKSQKNSDVDWDVVYAGLNLVKEQIKEGFPYKIIEVDNSEADDIIGVLAKKSTIDNIDTIIISKDKDFFQLHSKYVCQFRPNSKHIIRYNDARYRLQEQILRGDKDDGIPNVKSDDDTFVNPDKRQKKMMKADIPKMIAWDMMEFRAVGLDYNYSRNNLLIDLDNIPDYIIKDILNEFEIPVVKNKSKMVKFLMKHKLRYLHEKLNDFF